MRRAFLITLLTCIGALLAACALQPPAPKTIAKIRAWPL